MRVSRISSKGQVTIPKGIRESLGVRPGDLIAYEVQDGGVALRPVAAMNEAFRDLLSLTLDEWDTSIDDEAFHDL